MTPDRIFEILKTLNGLPHEYIPKIRSLKTKDIKEFIKYSEKEYNNVMTSELKKELKYRRFPVLRLIEFIRLFIIRMRKVSCMKDKHYMLSCATGIEPEFTILSISLYWYIPCIFRDRWTGEKKYGIFKVR